MATIINIYRKKKFEIKIMRNFNKHSKISNDLVGKYINKLYSKMSGQLKKIKNI